MMIALYAVAAVAAVAVLYVFPLLVLARTSMSAGVVLSIVAATLVLLWLVFCCVERKHQRQLQRLREGVDRLGSGASR
jgi:Flp pilus assembly protein TadB